MARDRVGDGVERTGEAEITAVYFFLKVLVLTVPQVEPRHENMCGASGGNYRFHNFKSVEQREPVCLHRHHLLRIFLRQKSVRLTEETACNSKTRLSPRIKAQTFPRVLLPGIAHS